MIAPGPSAALLSRKLVGLSLIAWMALWTSAADARDQLQFKTPDQAATALVAAVRINDERALLSVLGRDGIDIVSSGDAVADAATRREFVSAYEAKHEWTTTDNDKATLSIGQRDFPFPIPLVRRNGMWRFDTVAGRAEILSRRIGRNELAAIQACLAYYDAQHDYAEADRSGGGVRAYAQRIVSHPNKRDGLYWPASKPGDESPLGEMVANAATDGYPIGQGRAPFHGYYYKILTRQGSGAAGGELDYVVGGHMIGGFALVAYPARYGVSGIKTFIVSHNGVVYEKDLGPRTARAAERMTSFDLDRGWETVRVTVPPPNED